VFTVLWELEHNGSHCVLPVIKKVLLVLLNIHEFVHNMHFHVILSSIDCMLCWMVEMVLNSSGSKFIDEIKSGRIVSQIEVIVKKIYCLCCHEILFVVEIDLVRSASPEELLILLRLFVVYTIAMLIRTVIKHNVFDITIEIFCLRL